MGGDQCTTPQRTAGSCQYIFARQCRPVLTAILTQGVTQQLISYLIQAIRSPCGFLGFDFTLCCEDQNQPQITTQAPTTPRPTTQRPTTQRPTTQQPTTQTTGSLAGQSPGREIGRGLWSLAPRTPSAIDFRFNAVVRFLTRRRFSLQLTASTRLAGPMW